MYLASTALRNFKINFKHTKRNSNHYSASSHETEYGAYMFQIVEEET